MYTISQLLNEAKSRGASDLHISVGIPPKCRVNGNIIELYEERLSPLDTERLVFEMLGKERKEELESKGQVDLAYSAGSIGRYRVNIFRQRNSYAAVLRCVPWEIPSAEDLGLPDSVTNLANKKRGLVLVTGPTGSGKTTTLASLLNVINMNYCSHIITLEDPIEYLHFHDKSIVNQREVGQDTESFSTGLRAALREDPDVILVGEMRDLETISTAITAAETGHLVFATLHTIGAAETIDRVIDVFPPYQQQQVRTQLASVLEAVISQQLLPTADGDSRVAAFEVMLASSAVRNLIREGKVYQIPSILQISKQQGMQSMDDSIFYLYKAGKIKQETALSFSYDIAAFQKRFMKGEESLKGTW